MQVVNIGAIDDDLNSSATGAMQSMNKVNISISSLTSRKLCMMCFGVHVHTWARAYTRRETRVRTMDADKVEAPLRQCVSFHCYDLFGSTAKMTVKLEILIVN